MRWLAMTSVSANRASIIVREKLSFHSGLRGLGGSEGVGHLAGAR